MIVLFMRVLIGIFALAVALNVHSRELIKLYYEEREPYSSLRADGVVNGLIANPVSRAFTFSDVAFKWVSVPFKRQLVQLKDNTEAACGMVFFKTEEREKFGKFTHAIYRDGITVMLSRQDFQPEKNMHLIDAMSMKGARMLRKEASFYGPFIEDAMLKVKPTVVSTTAEMRNMALMLIADRADYTMLTMEEANYLIASIPDGDQLHVFRPVDMPSGQYRYIMCSKQVPDEVITRLNKAIPH